MLILVLNSGSSSVKYRLFDMTEDKCLAWGIVDRIGARGSVLTQERHDGHKVKLAGEIIDHQQAIEYILAILLSPNHGVVKDRSLIGAVGHRVVHGGEKFTGSTLITPEVMAQLHECIELAPLHNPANIKGIQACHSLMPNLPQVAVFDTAFHHKMPDYAYIYGLPYVLYKKYGVRRYGFHGTSHRYVADRAALMLNRPLNEIKLITCHLGNGCSMAAVDKGVSVDTTMGFTPTEGLLMGTRTGDLDPAALLHIISREEIGVGEANSLINKHSGLLGVSGASNDMREIESEVAANNPRALLALNIFCYRVKKYIGAYAAAMNGLDGVVFTGGIGENSVIVRQKSFEGLGFLGLEFDAELNAVKSKEERFIDRGSKARAMVIPTNEELVIARDTAELVGA
ncbi:MAG: acetate kinase [Calditrichaeota bacterium]|nr:acetate kinase [Calditrichota bacterium]